MPSKKRVKVIGLQRFSFNINALKNLVGQKGLDRALVRGGFVVEKAAKQNIRAQKLIDTGNLRSSIRTRLPKHGVVLVGTHVVYAAIHEFGGTITAKNAPWLVFKVGGQWVRTKSVNIRARPYLRPALDKNRPKVHKAIHKSLAHDIARLNFRV
jgi:HK97 gp10 family phage protein